MSTVNRREKLEKKISVLQANLADKSFVAMAPASIKDGINAEIRHCQAELKELRKAEAMENKSLHRQYIAGKRGHRIGLLVAKIDEGKLKFGWSLHSNISTHNTEHGEDIAVARMSASGRSFLKSGNPSAVFNLPHSAKHLADKFIKNVRESEKKKLEAAK